MSAHTTDVPATLTLSRCIPGKYRVTLTLYTSLHIAVVELSADSAVHAAIGCTLTRSETYHVRTDKTVYLYMDNHVYKAKLREIIGDKLVVHIIQKHVQRQNVVARFVRRLFRTNYFRTETPQLAEP
jgi:hypothetical protein